MNTLSIMLSYMLSDVIIITGISCLTVLLLSNTLYIKLLSSFNYLLDRKPFNCAMCLGFWSGLTIMCLTSNYTIAHIVLLSGITGITTELIDRVIIKI